MMKMSRKSLYIIAALMGVKIQLFDRIPFYGYERLRKRILKKHHDIGTLSDRAFRIAQHESYSEYEKGLA